MSFDSGNKQSSNLHLHTSGGETLLLDVRRPPGLTWGVCPGELSCRMTFTRKSGLGLVLPSPLMALESSIKDHLTFSRRASSIIRFILTV